MTWRRSLGFAWAWCALWVGPALAHPYHASLSEAEYNPKTCSLEVAFKVLTHDLERALVHHFGKKKALPLEEADRQIALYLAEVFRLHCPGPSPPTLVWIGKEIEIRETWLYFEFPLPHDLAGCTIENRFLFDQEPTQLNTLQLKIGTRTTTVNLSRERPEYVVGRED